MDSGFNNQSPERLEETAIKEMGGLYGNYSPTVVKAAEAFEKTGNLLKALELYKKGIEYCAPEKILVHDEKTGGDVPAVNYPEHNKREIKEAEELVKICKDKIRYIEKKLSL